VEFFAGAAHPVLRIRRVREIPQQVRGADTLHSSIGKFAEFEAKLANARAQDGVMRLVALVELQTRTATRRTEYSAI
jgi:hypothetical protein